MRRRLPILLSLLAILAAALCGLWYWGTGVMLERLAEWRTARQAEGIEVAWAEAERAGFPLQIASLLTQPRIAHPLGWSWSGEAVSAETSLFSLDRFALQAVGRQQLSWPGMPAGETPASLEAAVARGEAAFDSHGTAEGLKVTLQDFRASGPFEGGWIEGGQALLRIARADDPEAYPEGFLGQGGLRATALLLPEELEAPLGPSVDLLDVTANLTGPHPDLRLPPRRLVAQWRDGGGTLDVTHLALDWGPLTLKGDGRLTLDEEFRPLGAFSLKVKGLAETIELLARKGLIENGAAFALQAGSLALGKVDPEDGRPEVQLPLTLQDGWLSLGPLPLARLQPLPLPD